jgi:hypothetical protein
VKSSEFFFANASKGSRMSSRTNIEEKIEYQTNIEKEKRDYLEIENFAK